MTSPTRKGQPLNPKSDNPSLNSRLHAATGIQSQVTPEDYPAEAREGQTAVVGKARPHRAKASPAGTGPRAGH